MPGVGKTTLAKALSQELSATYIRIDSIEQRIESSALNVTSAEDAGYLVAYKVAMDNLINGQSVVGDSVNPIELTRKDWRDVAECAGCAFIELEVVCTDKDERRVRLLKRFANNLKQVKSETPAQRVDIVAVSIFMVIL